MSYAKLVPEIVLSSIWEESPEVRCVWIAMIATKDKDGNVRGNPRSLARLANVSKDAAQEALNVLQSPDPDSNNPDQEGRRIQPIPGGWHIISHDLYRSKDFREYEAERKKAYRQKSKEFKECPGHVPDIPVSVSVSSSVSKEGERREGEPKPKKPTVVLPFESTAFSEAWSAWREHRRKIRKPMTNRAETLALGKLPKAEAEAIRWIDTAIEKGWQGIYEPQDNGNGAHRNGAPQGATSTDQQYYVTNGGPK